jgi:hypothetical protein
MKVRLAAALPSRMAGANVHEPDHDRDKTDQDDAGSKYSGEDALIPTAATRQIANHPNT